MATVRFLGAAQEVTGSCHMIESPELGRILLDCGMHQGGNAAKRLPDEYFEFAPASINAVVLSHAHLDHSGMLPKLVHEGFNGVIHATSATVELLEVMLLDSVNLYLSDLERTNRRRLRRGKEPLEPIYTEQDVAKVLSLSKAHPYGQPFKVATNASVTFHDAGHILGSAITEFCIEEKGKSRTLVFSGDLGNKSAILMNDPTILEKADVVLMEGTYGDRNHRPIEDTVEQLRTIIRETEHKGGNIMIPAFAVGRTQELLFYLGQLYKQGDLQNWQVILDSPMAIEVTKVYDHWFNQLDKEDIKLVRPAAHSILKDFIPRLLLSSSPQDSMAINKISKGALIIAGSGMCTGGRIRHHFKQRIWDSRSTVIFCGFQARGTLGRLLVDGKKHIKLFGEDYLVKARIETLGGFSAHAGQSELIEWVSHFKGSPRIMLVHGESTALDTLSNKLWTDKNIEAEIAVQNHCIAF
ncbi:MBL fold metallo-hydrolase RNA specificity domain-containing protein [Neptunicella marina]|uniref:MBL fold metallo-hydrolase n=1 Tax=Neptunicella marina TaxID=2125989 RepID=A0A8J6LWX4_9ALTE|nr:MBL fold metallo-hydrolase [Neptunicella marina]MBC3764450.1 MBL fold metallo-hydrolase [Neptunicella marina]